MEFFFFAFLLLTNIQNAGPAPSPIGQLPPNEGMPGGPMAPNFFPVSVGSVHRLFLFQPIEQILTCAIERKMFIDDQVLLFFFLFNFSLDFLFRSIKIESCQTNFAKQKKTIREYVKTTKKEQNENDNEINPSSIRNASNNFCL